MKRLLKTSVILLVILCTLASGFDAALDRMSGGVTQNSFTVYDDQGTVMYAYQGDLARCRMINRPVVIIPNGLHRT